MPPHLAPTDPPCLSLLPNVSVSSDRVTGRMWNVKNQCCTLQYFIISSGGTAWLKQVSTNIVFLVLCLKEFDAKAFFQQSATAMYSVERVQVGNTNSRFCETCITYMFVDTTTIKAHWYFWCSLTKVSGKWKMAAIGRNWLWNNVYLREKCVIILYTKVSENNTSNTAKWVNM